MRVRAPKTSKSAQRRRKEATVPIALPPGAALVDEQLEQLSHDIDFLLWVTPVNLDEAWVQFRDGGCRVEPEFLYRPLPPNLPERRRLIAEVSLDQIEDPVVLELLSEKHEELERRMRLLQLRGTSGFKLGALRLYGAVDEELMTLANELRDTTESSIHAGAREKCLDVHDVVRRACKELLLYREEYPNFPVTIEIRDDITAGMMVSRGRLLISRTARFRDSRVHAILQHEIGTHLVTYYNGACQPLKQLMYGLAGYEGLQEGLATLAEFLAGGLEPKRMRKLAARVAAAGSMSNGATFTDTFLMLRHDWHYSEHDSFLTTVRVFRGGGLTKDAIYLKGLRTLLQHLHVDPDIEPLLVGKIALWHLPLLHDLQKRGLVVPPRVLPRYLASFETRERLGHCSSLTLTQLLGEVRS